MNIELKPIAESKVRQLGGDVCGVLVRKEAGAYAAVDEHGRVMWLDSWGEADRAQGGQGAGVVGYTNRRQLQFPVNGWGMLWPEKSELADVELYTQPQPAVPDGWSVRRSGDRVTVQHPGIGGYCASNDGNDHSAIAPVILYHLASALLSTPTTPQADGWISMKDQFPNTFTPKLGWNKTANMRHQANTYRIFSPMAENVCDISHWMDLPHPPKEGE